MAEQAELAFVKSFANAISSQPVVYGNDYQTAPENELKRVPVLPVCPLCCANAFMKCFVSSYTCMARLICVERPPATV